MVSACSPPFWLSDFASVTQASALRACPACGLRRAPEPALAPSEADDFGGDFLVDCRRRLAQASEALGVAVVMLGVLDCGDPEKVERRLALYKGYGFETLTSNPLRLFLPMATVRAFLDAET
jgi:hypothetical protein